MRVQVRVLGLLCGLLPLSVQAQQSDWTYSVNIYAWIPGLDASIDTPLGELNSRTGGGDILDSLDMAFMGTFEARKNRWGLLIDGVYAKLSTSKDTPFGLAYSEGEVRTELSAISAYALYRSYDSERLKADIGLGLRVFDVNLDIGLDAGQVAKDLSFGASETWVVPLIAGRFITPINEKWFAVAYFDYGQNSDDEITWQGVATIGYRFNDRWALQGGYRYMELEQEIGGLESDLSLSGPVIGLNIRF